MKVYNNRLMTPPRKTLPETAVPLYVAVADRLRQRVERGEWGPGEHLPSLHQLAEEFGVARLTARQAVQRLVAEGLLTSQRGQGTVVAQEVRQVQTVPLETSLRELGRPYRTLVPIILAKDETPRALPGLQGREEGYVYMHRLHMDDGRPYCVISLYIAQSVYALAPEQFRTRAVVPVMLDDEAIEIAQAHQTLTIGTADAEVADLLHIPLHAPVAHVQRIFRAPDASIIYYAEVTYRGDAIRLEIDLKN